jgi:hypothetical protein
MSEELIEEKGQNKIDLLEEEIQKLEKQIQLRRREIEFVRVGDSPIKPGDIIVWKIGESTKSTRMRRGVVISVSTSCWRGFSYRCKILSKENKAIGFANVSSDHFPTLEGYEE